MRLRILVFLLLAATGCQTALMPGSVYRQTDRIRDLLAEPTFDVGADPAAVHFYSFRVPHYDADGHGLFDIPMVISEQLFFAPTWLLSGLLRLTASEAYLGGGPPGPPGQGPSGGAVGMARSTVGYMLGVPGAMFYLAGVGSATAFDVAAHDVPVVFIGRPLRWVGELASGG